MGSKINNIPVFNALIDDEHDRMLKISLVDDPAVMSNFVAFDNEKAVMMYSVADEEKRIVRGVVMRADFPIYRYSKKEGEYYIIYQAETIRKMAEKYLAEGRQNNFNLMHEKDSDVEGVQMVQFFIKDSANGISPSGYEEIADGSLFGEFHVQNDDVWDAIKNGTYKGFSLEGYFSVEPNSDQDEVNDIVNTLDGKFTRLFKINKSIAMGKLKRLKEALAKALAEFGNMTTNKGILAWDGDDDLKVGDNVFIEDEDGTRTPAEDGDYTTEDNRTIRVAEGKVAEIIEASTDTGTELGRVTTDKGELSWDGEGDLKEGDAVYVTKDGETVAAEDGDYTTEDGKVIKVVDGKVESITDKESQTDNTDNEDEELKANRLAHFNRIKEAFSESYDDKVRKISEAILAEGFTGYVTEAGDDYAVICCYNSLTGSYRYYRFAISWDADLKVVLGDYVEVRPGYIPVQDGESNVPANTSEDVTSTTEEEMSAIKAENEQLKAELETLKKTPAAMPAHEVVKASAQFKKTGDRRLDRLAKYAELAAESRKR